MARSAADATGHGTADWAAMTLMHSGAEGSAGAGAVEKQLMRHATGSGKGWRGAPVRWELTSISVTAWQRRAR
jgi:hypothetical protein